MSESALAFHLAIPVGDLEAACDFYVDVLHCKTGRSDARWIDLDFFGHQVTLHLVAGYEGNVDTNPVDGDKVPARHFGVVLDMADWRGLAERLESAEIQFLIPPRTRFEGKIGEQATMFFFDPSGNALEFKGFDDASRLFAT